MPNLPVDMDSWGRLACYPYGNFYPMSDGLSIRNRRITKTYFRTCSRCLSRSQAPLCFCTQQLISKQLEGTFARLRYSLGGDRPSQTARQEMSFAQIHGSKLERKLKKSGISLFPPQKPKSLLQRVPPMLRILSLRPIPAYSKAQ